MSDVSEAYLTASINCFHSSLFLSVSRTPTASNIFYEGKRDKILRVHPYIQETFLLQNSKGEREKD